MLGDYGLCNFPESARRSRESDEESRSEGRCIFDHYRATVVMNHFAHDGKTQTGSGRFPKADKGVK
jgi:hypothetical protein